MTLEQRLANERAELKRLERAARRGRIFVLPYQAIEKKKRIIGVLEEIRALGPAPATVRW